MKAIAIALIVILIAGFAFAAHPEESHGETHEASKFLGLPSWIWKLINMIVFFGLLGWVPTVSLDMHLRTLPSGDWLKAVQRSQLIADNWLDETCDLYDENGRLVGSARQFAGYRP